MIKSHSYLDFFPYPVFRSEQQEIIERIERGARLRKNILLFAPNGTGKTVIVLSGLLSVALEKGLKIIYMCRTHTQNKRVIKELKKIYSSSSQYSSKISGLSIRGRGEMCLHRKIINSKMGPKEAMTECKALRSNQKCPHYLNLKEETNGLKEPESVSFSSPVDGEELIEFCKKEEFCPYYLSKLLLKGSLVIVCNYQWIFNLDIRYRFLKQIGVDLSKCILIIDECHNILELSCEVNSNKLTPNLLTNCQSEIFTYGFPEIYTTFVSYLKNLLDYKKDKLIFGDTKITRIKAKTILKNIYTKLKLRSIIEFRSFLKDLRKEYQQRIETTRNPSQQNFETLVKFWLEWIKKYNNEKYYFCYNLSKGVNKKYISLEIVALDPRDITLPLFFNSYMSLNLSGTINPQVFTYLTGLNCRKGKFLEINARSPFKKNNILALITKGVDTKKENRVSGMYKKIIWKVKEVVENTPANVGIFCASYKVLRDLEQNGIRAVLEKTGKKIFIESSENSASVNDRMLKNFKRVSRAPYKGGVLLGVSGGRNSEGEDYPGGFMNAVIIIGIPFQAPSPRNQAKIDYYDKTFNRKGWIFAYLFPAMQKANQASGRPIRREEDRGAIVFMDSRFKERFGWISEWVRNEIKIYPDRKNVISTVFKRFWDRTN